MNVFQQATPEEPSDDLQHILGITDEELKARIQSFNEIRKMNFFEHLTPIQQERLRQSVLLDKLVPKVWDMLGFQPGRQRMLQRIGQGPLVHRVVASSLPSVPREDVLRRASTQLWWRRLSSQERSQLSKLILLERNIPEGFTSWREAVQSPLLGDWIEKNKAKLLWERPMEIPFEARKHF